MRKYVFIFIILKFFSLFFILKRVDALLVCKSPLKYCSENYKERCTTRDGRSGTKQCFKEGCNETGGGGPSCPWQGSSRCGECVPDDNNPPPPPNVSLCNQTEGGGVGICVKPDGRYCQPSCNNEWNASPNEPNVECRRVSCSPCGNNTTCCRKVNPPTNPPTNPSPPPTEVPMPTPSYTTPPVNPPKTPTPTLTKTPTPTITPSPTPTIFYVTATPRPTESSRYEVRNQGNVSYIWICLRTEAYNGNQYGPGLDHRLKATGQLPHSYGQDIYIVGCVTNNQTIYCTTGNSERDRYLGISKLDQHTFQLLHPQNPFKIGTNTNSVEAYVRSTTRDFMTHTIYAVYRNPSLGNEFGQGGLQQGTTIFSSSDETKCVLIKWDPKGKVIDYYTKKPVNNVEIILLDEKGKKIIEPGLVNPKKTKEDGSFDFFISEDNNRLYKIKVNLPKDYRLIDNKEIINKLPKEFSDSSKYIIYSENLILKLNDIKNKEVIIFIRSNKENFWRKILNFFIN